MLLYHLAHSKAGKIFHGFLCKTRVCVHCLPHDGVFRQIHRFDKFNQSRVINSLQALVDLSYFLFLKGNRVTELSISLYRDDVIVASSDDGARLIRMTADL
jgi:hypothetical protein